MMLEIASTLNDVKFDDIKKCIDAKEIWDKLALVHGEHKNVLRPRVECLRGKYDDIRMKEGKIVV